MVLLFHSRYCIPCEIVDNKKKGFYALKLDMSKAYDRVEWDFVEVLLKKFEFLKRLIHLIMGCIFAVKYSILLNGSPLTPIASTRGLR